MKNNNGIRRIIKTYRRIVGSIEKRVIINNQFGSITIPKIETIKRYINSKIGIKIDKDKKAIIDSEAIITISPQKFGNIRRGIVVKVIKAITEAIKVLNRNKAMRVKIPLVSDISLIINLVNVYDKKLPMPETNKAINTNKNCIKGFPYFRVELNKFSIKVI